MARHVFAINRNGIDALCYLQLDSPIARLQLNADHEKLPHPANAPMRRWSATRAKALR